MKFIYLCVNYDSSSTLSITLPLWREMCVNLDIYVVDNFKSEVERELANDVCKKNNACLICNENSGYGSALNIGISEILTSQKYTDDCILFFGNADIAPKKIIENFQYMGAPVLNILQNHKELNPFLTKFESRFIWILCLAAKIKSQLLLKIWLIIRKLLTPFRGSAIAAVHGSLFCLSIADTSKLHPIFNPKVFLYCEELFFMKKIKKNEIKYCKSNYIFEHIGSVSTNKSIKLNKKAYFENWCKSMRIYCEDKM